MIITRPDSVFKAQVVDEIITALGRTVTFHYVTGTSVCPTCSGLNAFCQTCYGNPSVETISTQDIVGTVKWKVGVLPESKYYKPEGQYAIGDCQVVIAYDDSYEDILDATRKVVVDDRNCVIRGYYYRGEPERNRIYVILDESERADGSYRV